MGPRERVLRHSRHSNLRAIIGSTLDACRTGIAQASMATGLNSSVPATGIIGSGAFLSRRLPMNGSQPGTSRKLAPEAVIFAHLRPDRRDEVPEPVNLKTYDL